MNEAKRGTRFTIGQILGVTAILATLLVARLDLFDHIQGAPGWFIIPWSIFSGIFLSRSLFHEAIGLALILVCFKHVSLSPKLRIALIGLIGAYFCELLQILSILFEGRIFMPIRLVFSFNRLIELLGEGFQIVFIWGLLLTFRDLQSRPKFVEVSRDEPEAAEPPNPWSPP